MSISRRRIVLSGIAVVLGCERVAPPDATQRPRVATQDDHLGIESSRYDGHTWGALVVNDALLHRPEEDDTVFCQMVAEPSFKDYDAAIYLRRREASWELVARQAVASLGNSLRLRVDKGMELARAIASLQDCMEEFVRPIPEDIASTLQQVWTEMLLRARAKAYPGAVPDGTTFSFAHHHLAGMAISPPRDSLTGRLVTLGRLLLEATTLRGAKYQAVLDEVGQRALALSKDVSQLWDPEPDKASLSIRRLYGKPIKP